MAMAFCGEGLAEKLATKKISSNSIKQLQSLLGNISEEDCRVLIEEYGTEGNDLTEVAQVVFEVLESAKLSSVADLVWHIRQNPCFEGRRSRSLNDRNSHVKDSWMLARSRSSNTIAKQVSGLPMATQPRPASATAQMEATEGSYNPMPYSSTRNPIKFLRIPKGVEPTQMRPYLSKYMQDLEMSNILYELHENQSIKFLILMRGASGSGKSTLASLIWSITEKGEICSADHYFVQRNGQYRFNRASLGEAHESCRKHCRTAMSRGDNPVIIDNTNTRVDEMLPYVQLAIDYNYAIKILEPNTDWRRKPGTLANKTIHNVPRATIQSQVDRFEKTTEDQLIDKVLRRQSGTISGSKQNYNPTQPLDWGAASSISSLETWTPMTSALNSVINPTPPPPIPNLFQFPNPRPMQVTKPKTSPPAMSNPFTPSHVHQIHQSAGASWIEPMAVRPPSPLLLSSLVPDLTSGNSIGKPKRSHKKSGGGGGNSPPAAQAVVVPQGLVTTSPVQPYAFEDPVHIIFNKLQRLFPSADRDKLEQVFNEHEGDLDECAGYLLEEGYQLAEMLDEPEEKDVDPVREVVVQVEHTKPLESNFEELLKWENAGATGLSSEFPEASYCSTTVPLEKPASSSSTPEDLRSIQFDMNYETPGDSGVLEEEQDTFEMTLPLDFARVLLSAYGHPDDEKRSLSSEELTIKLATDTAFELYKSLYINMHKTETEGSRSDSSEESTRSNSPASSSVSNADDEFDAIAISLSQMELETNSRNPQLASIMDIESKISQHKEEFLKYYGPSNRTMAQNIKFSRLKQDFPFLDEVVINEVYTHCLLDDEKTRNALMEMYPSTQPIPGTSKSTSRDNTWGVKYNPKDIRMYSPDELRRMQCAHDDLEKEWLSQYSKIKDYHQKCKNTNNAQIRSHYFSEAKKLTESMKSLADEMQYYKVISLNARHNNDQILDLHGLKINGAMRVLKEFLQFKEEEFRASGIPKMILLIITGQGKHSKNGYPVLQPAVRNFLSQKRYKFHSSKPGTYSVILTRSTVPKKK